MMNDETDKDRKRHFWEEPGWQCVSFGNKEMSAWYREYLKRREEGMSNEFDDILSSYDFYKEDEIRNRDADKSL